HGLDDQGPHLAARLVDLVEIAARTTAPATFASLPALAASGLVAASCRRLAGRPLAPRLASLLGAPFALGAGHQHLAPLPFVVVERSGGGLGLRDAAHLDEGEALRPPG